MMAIDGFVVVLVLALLLVFLLSGVPVAISLGASGAVGIFLIDDLGSVRSVLGNDPFSTAANFTLIVIPLFVLMGYFVNHARIGEELFGLLARKTTKVPGGLAIASIMACAGFGAVTGASVSAVATIGPIAIREMRRYGYSKETAAGVIAASGTLGILIPPSIALVIFGILAQTSIERLLIAGLVPGVVSASVYAIITIFLAVVQRRRSASLDTDIEVSASASRDGSASARDGEELAEAWNAVGRGTDVPRSPAKKGEVSLRKTEFSAVAKIAFLFGVIFGGIYFGIFTVTESAAVGAFAAMLMLVASRWRQGLREVLQRLGESVSEGTSISSMLFLLLIGGGLFGFFILLSGIPRVFTGWVLELDVPGLVVVALILVAMLVLGMFLDGISILLITVPLTAPVVIGGLGFDPLWYGVLLVKSVEIGLITPPLGINAYVTSSIVDDIPVESVFRGVAPYFVADLVTVVLLFFVPVLVTGLPELMLR